MADIEVSGTVTCRLDIQGCARCGQDHEQVPFFPFVRPVVTDDGTLQATHWGVCDETCEPILLLRTEESAGEPSSSPSSEAGTHTAEDGAAP